MSAGLVFNVFACGGTVFFAVVAAVVLCENGRLTARLQDERDENNALALRALVADWDRGAAQGELQAFLDRQVGRLVDDALDGEL